MLQPSQELGQRLNGQGLVGDGPTGEQSRDEPRSKLFCITLGVPVANGCSQVLPP